MQFKDVIGQEEVKQRLLEQFSKGRQPHALLLSGPEGCGSLAMAIALGSYLLCSNRSETDSCGECPACRQIMRWGHPDLHFSFPIIKKDSERSATCNDYMDLWKEMLKDNLYFGMSDWLEKMDAGNKQALITEAESDNILSKLSMTAYEGGYKVMIVWLPERLHVNAANNLLKYLEEPAPQTVFILVTENVGAILPTILSRTQWIEMSRLPETVIAEALQQRNGLEREVAIQMARTSGGSYLNALRAIHVNSVANEFFNSFVSLMRLAYSRDIRGLQSWADDVASWGRERQKSFMTYSQNMLRENFMYNFHRSELNFMTDEETAFASRFARFINERNVVEFMREMSQAQRDTEQNVNTKTVFFDFALKAIILIRK